MNHWIISWDFLRLHMKAGNEEQGDLIKKRTARNWKRQPFDWRQEKWLNNRHAGEGDCQNGATSKDSIHQSIDQSSKIGSWFWQCPFAILPWFLSSLRRYLIMLAKCASLVRTWYRDHKSHRFVTASQSGTTSTLYSTPHAQYITGVQISLFADIQTKPTLPQKKKNPEM